MADFTHLISTREFLTFYYKNRGRLMLAFFLPFILAVGLSFVPAPRYVASSVLTVRMGSEYVYTPETGSGQNTQQTTIPFDRDEIFKTEVAILSSADLHKDVIREVGIENLYPGIMEKEYPEGEDKEAAAMSAAVLKFDKRFSASLEKESSVITITYEHPNPELATKVLDTLLNMYLEKRKALYLEPRVEMAKARATESRKHVLAAENAVEAFRKTHNILSFDSERQNLIQQRSEIQRQAASVSSPGLNEKLAYFEDKLDQLNKEEAQFNALNHDVAIANDEDSLFAHRLSEAVAYEDMEHERAGSVRIIQPPSVPAEPKKLQPIIILAGFILSLLSMLAVGLIIDFLTSGFTTPEQLAKAIGLPVLATLPYRRYR